MPKYGNLWGLGFHWFTEPEFSNLTCVNQLWPTLQKVYIGACRQCRVVFAGSLLLGVFAVLNFGGLPLGLCYVKLQVFVSFCLVKLPVNYLSIALGEIIREN
jgi:hypothetical protein